ncbi:hypothetical protein [Enterococcus camelliae]|jgi:cytidylate kinase|uniref:Uncharacterized protein n=1 Tax=Enterococcus camelliae TaxID=453959 RepID=A0ABW5TFU4_9ENTE
MIVALIGESCTGKSTLADRLQREKGATVFIGKDYLRMAKNEQEAAKLFTELLAKPTDQLLVYVISEDSQLHFLPEHAQRIIITADLATKKTRFSKRMNGQLPEPVCRMLERNHGLFDKEAAQLRIDTSFLSIEEAAEQLLQFLS